MIDVDNNVLPVKWSFYPNVKHLSGGVGLVKLALALCFIFCIPP